MENEKIGFFKRVKIAIFNLEKYSIFANEKFSKALKYLIILVVIVTLALAVSSTIKLSEETGKLIAYIKSEEFPDFELKDGKLEADKKLNSYDEEYNARLIIDTTENISKEEIDNYKKEAKNSDYSVIFLRDKIIYRFDTTLENGYESTYNNLTSFMGISDINRKELVDKYLSDSSLSRLRMILGVYAFITILLLNIVTLLEDILVIGIFGWLASKIARVQLTIGKTVSLGIYSLTLSIILSAVYSIVYSFTNFEIKYFEVMYMIIAYIYIVAAIMIMKEVNKGAGEVVTVEGQVMKQEDEEKENASSEDNKKDKKTKKPEKKDEEKEDLSENKEENINDNNDVKE